MHKQQVLSQEFTTMADRKVAFMGKHTQALRYGEGNRPGSTLAQLLRTYRQQNHINEQVDESGSTLHRIEEILGEQAKYYSQLYMALLVETSESIHKYLKEVAMICLTDIQLQFLCNPIATEEIMAALNSLDVAKASGTDHLTGNFYQT